MLVTIIVNIILLSTNPFLIKLNTLNKGINEEVSELTSKDFNDFLILDQTHKILNSTSFLFFDNQVLFMAFKMDSTNNKDSFLIYVKPVVRFDINKKGCAFY